MPTRDGDAVLVAVIAATSKNVAQNMVRSPIISVSGFLNINMTPLATISGLPTSFSKDSSLTLTINDVNSYRYKIVQGSATCGDDPTDYSSWTENSGPLVISNLGADGVKRLCVIGAKNGVIQASVTNYLWTKDTVAPGAFNITAPAAITRALDTTVSWQSSSSAAKYDVKIASDEDCATVVRSQSNILLTTNYAVSGLVPGSYYVCVTASDEAGNTVIATNNGYHFDIDFLISPTTIITSDTSGGADSRFASGTTAYISWSGASDTQLGVSSYTLTSYPAADCGGTGTNAPNATAPYTFTGTAGTTYSFTITAVNSVKTATSLCSKPIKLLGAATAPLALDGFSAATGLRTGEIILTLDFPASPAYTSVAIRRIPGATAPSDRCNDGTVVKTYTSFVDGVYYDATGSLAGEVFSYRACITGTNSEVRATNKVENIAAKLITHKIFSTSISYIPADLGGLAGADTICANVAGDAFFSAAQWRAVLSSETVDAKSRILITGPVYNTKNEQVAQSTTDFWDGIAKAIYDEFGGAGLHAITGSMSSGMRLNGATCNGWTSTDGYSYEIGYGGYTGTTWLNATTRGCTIPAVLVCVGLENDPPALTSFTATTGTVTSGDVVYNLTVPADVSHYSKVEIRRALSNDGLSDICTTGTVIDTQLRGNIVNRVNVIDSTGITNSWFNYQACAFDLEDNLISVINRKNVKPKNLVAFRMFTTSTFYDGNLGGLAGADAKCATRASAAGLTGTWKALLSSSASGYNAIQRVTSNGPYFNLNARGYKKIADTKADLFDLSIATPISFTEFGIYISVAVLTGSDANGVKSNNCSDWTAAAPGNGTADGISTSIGSAWIYEYHARECCNNYSLYCFEFAQ